MRWILIAATLTALALPGTVHAATVGFTGDVLVYTAAPGEANNLTLVLGTEAFSCGTRPAPCLDLLEFGNRSSITAFPADRCAPDGSGTVECDVPASVVANLGDGDDAMFDWDGPSTINGGDGNEATLQGSGGADRINGGPGSDLLFGGDGNDALDGGEGNDSFEGLGTLTPTNPPSTGGTDVYVGGPGRDFLDYAGRSEPLTVSLDGAANDGAAGEADTVGADIEAVRGGEGADTITGNEASNSLDGRDADDTLRGGAGEDELFGNTGNDRTFGEDGQDTIEGGDGDDAVDGGAGIDVLYGDQVQVCIPGVCASGRDTIAARDGAADSVTCGPGEDSAVLDAGDRVSEVVQDACERVDRSAGGESGGGPAGGGDPGATTDTVVPQIRSLRGGRLRRGRSITIRYSLSEAATVTFTLERRAGARWRRLGRTFRQAGRAGPNRLRFTGRLTGSRLRTGRYHLVAVALDAAGNRSPARRTSLRVVP